MVKQTLKHIVMPCLVPSADNLGRILRLLYLIAHPTKHSSRCTSCSMQKRRGQHRSRWLSSGSSVPLLLALLPPADLFLVLLFVLEEKRQLLRRRWVFSDVAPALFSSSQFQVFEKLIACWSCMMLESAGCHCQRIPPSQQPSPLLRRA